MRKLLLLTAICLLFTGAKAQQSIIDSLQKKLSTQHYDTSHIATLSEISRQYLYINTDSAHKYISKLGALSNTLKFNYGIIRFNYLMMHYHNFTKQIDSAIWYGNQMAETALANNDLAEWSKAYLSLADIAAFNGDIEKGLEYCFEGIKRIREKNAITPEIEADFYMTIANIYLLNNDYEKAGPYYENAILILRKIGGNKEYDLLSPLVNLGNVQLRMSLTDKADRNYKEALGIAQKFKNELYEGVIYQGLVDIAQRKGNLSEMKEYAEKSLKIARQKSDSVAISLAMSNLSIYYTHTGNYDESKKLLTEAVSIAHRQKDRNSEAIIYLNLSNNEAARHNFLEMNRYRILADNAYSKLYTEEVAKHQGDFEAKYKTFEKETTIQLQQAQLKQKNILNYILIGSAIALLLISLLAYRSYKQKQKLQQVKIDELETEKKLTATEAILKGEEQERSRLAKDLHDGLGGMLSGIKYSFQNMKQNLILTPDNAQAFERSIDMLDSSIKEMRRVAHNMMPEVLVKYGLDTALKEFCLEINRSSVLRTSYQSIGLSNNDKDVEQTTAIAIYRIVQELVNNSIKHAAAKHLLVQAHLHDAEKLLTLTVEDDGKGFDSTLLTQTKGIGWSSIHNRVDFLKGKIDIQSTRGSGTSVLIEINLS